MKRICVRLSKERTAGGRSCLLLRWGKKRCFARISCLRGEKKQSGAMKYLGARDTQRSETQIHPLMQKKQSHMLHFIGERSPAFTTFYSLNSPRTTW